MDKNKSIEDYTPDEMRNPFEEIRQTDAGGREWWNSRLLARVLGYSKYWNFERLIEKVSEYLQRDKGLTLNEHFVEVDDTITLGNSGARKVKSLLMSRTACLSICMNADQRKPMVSVGRQYFADRLSDKEALTALESNMLVYRSSRGKVQVDVIFNNETFWLSQQRMSQLFGVDVSTINYHIHRIDESGEVHLPEAIRKIQISSEQCSADGVYVYNLDVVIAVGYRVNSYEATQFRIWATGFLDMAEGRARRHTLMTMQDWSEFLSKFLQLNNMEVQMGKGTISHEQAEEKAHAEYDKYRIIQDQTFLSDFDKLTGEGILP